jgi:hypothetical protein
VCIRYLAHCPSRGSARSPPNAAIFYGSERNMSAVQKKIKRSELSVYQPLTISSNRSMFILQPLTKKEIKTRIFLTPVALARNLSRTFPFLFSPPPHICHMPIAPPTRCSPSLPLALSLAINQWHLRGAFFFMANEHYFSGGFI